MINSLWISKTGMEAQQMQLDVITNNLANVSTNGFKRSTAVFEDLMYQNHRQVGTNSTEQAQLPTGLQIGLGVRTVATSRSFTQGALHQTNNRLDVAIQGDGFFQITMPDGSTGYTRDGAFQVNSAGTLVTSTGLPVANGVTVPPNATNVTIDGNGTVTATIPGDPAPQNIGTIALARFVNPAGLTPLGQNLFAESAASGQPNAGTPGADGMGSLLQCYVESSNVNVVQELVTMIQTQRAYELNSKGIQTSDQMLQKLTQI
ncbi:flagellar basal-body rod protein FlgG [Candidatus Symbiobacter mobilis]|uniref:Flagellar basal-body rod protein FlgG n=1 Tax=Candidatus Symbiobacter mobilis CR TaxID=946483 RepID=U5N7Y8_9BURK|nr:flagellar basal-body rod protein FlgG [Candidatus Symbiobacter mobilis]AGX87410.1 flagellar basal body rod protein FlgG [Candidatus Symbiobacter mobilis CR]